MKLKNDRNCYSALQQRQNPYPKSELMNSNQHLNSLNSLNHSQIIDDNTRRYRTAFSREQLQILEKEFLIDSYVSRPKRCDLAQQLKLSEGTIKVWFQNRRMKQKRESERHKMVLPWAYATDPHFAYLFAAAAYSQMQQSDFWQQQAKNGLLNTTLMQQSNGQPRLPTMPNLMPATGTTSLFVAPPLLPNTLLNSTSSNSTSSISMVNNDTVKTESTNNESSTSLNSISSSSYLPPTEFSYNLMLRSLGLNTATLQQQHQQRNSLVSDPGFLNHLRELSEAQSNESSNFKNENEIKSSLLDFRSSSSASNNSSDCSAPSTPTPIQTSTLTTTTNSNYLTNSSSPSSLSGHNNLINQKKFKSNLSLKNLNQLDDCDSTCSLNSPILNQLNEQNSINSNKIKKEFNSKIDLNAIEEFNNAILNSHKKHKTTDLINSNCASSLLINKPLFQPYNLNT